jgi:hypothetical protein
MRQIILLTTVMVLAGCASGPKLPPPNSAQTFFDRSANAVQVTISSVAPPTGAVLVSASGARYPAAGLFLLSSPHVAYNPPPSYRFRHWRFRIWIGRRLRFRSRIGPAGGWPDSVGGKQPVCRFGGNTAAARLHGKLA